MTLGEPNPLPPSEPPPPSVRVRRYVPVVLQCSICRTLLTRPGIDTHRLTDCTPPADDLSELRPMRLLPLEVEDVDWQGP